MNARSVNKLSESMNTNNDQKDEAKKEKKQFYNVTHYTHDNLHDL